MSIGQPTPRVEGPLKVTGAAKYAADNHPDGMLYAVIVGSPVPAGEVKAIETAEAAATPGVVRILTHEDMPKIGEVSMPAAVTYIPLTTREVQWEGQAVALVLAETLEAAEEAAALVRVEIAPSPALMPGRGRIEPAPEGYLFAPRETKGSLAAGLGEADRKLQQAYFQPTRNHNPMETSSCTAAWDGDRLTLWDASQMNLNPPQVMAAAFAIPKQNVRMISPHTGGGFGCKGHVWPHVVLAAAAAKVAGRPVRL